MSEKPLSERERRFVDAYCVGTTAGNAAASLRSAGYATKSANVTASRMMARANVKTAIANKLSDMKRAESALTTATIATKVQLQEWWTRLLVEGDVFVDDDGHKVATPVRLQDRIKASELMGKSLGIFIEKREHAGEDGKPIQHKVTFGGRYKP